MKILTHIVAWLLCMAVWLLCILIGKCYLEIESFPLIMTWGLFAYLLAYFVKWLIIKEDSISEIFPVDNTKIKSGTYQSTSGERVYVCYGGNRDTHITLDGRFTVKELEFFVGIMKGE